MPANAELMTMDSIGLLHRKAINSPEEVERLLRLVAANDTPLTNGIDGKINPRSAHIQSVHATTLVLSVENIDVSKQPQLYLGFELAGSRYFFAADVVRELEAGLVEVALPPAIHEAERRSLPRQLSSAPVRVDLSDGPRKVRGTIIDRSYEGLGVEIPAEAAVAVGSRVFVSSPEATQDSLPSFGLVRNSTHVGGWKRVGLSVSAVPFGPTLPVDSRRQILVEDRPARLRRRLRFYGAGLAAAGTRLSRTLGIDAGSGEVEVLRYANPKGREIVAIADRVGGQRGSVAVVIAPAWGRTKETMLPLAAVLAETFAAAGRPAVILRFDGTNRRGESWIDPPFRSPGSEYLGFRFSDAVEDIHATIDFVTKDESILASRVVLVTASLASVEGRRAVATDPTGAIAGWVSLVGMVDLHSGLRAASGGIDYAYGLERGVAFGRHELAGVVADMDLTGRDVLDHHLGLFEDARRDMAKIEVPITWIHGRYDGWIDVERVRDLMSAGRLEERQLIEVPTGHQLRSSRQALETFQLVAQEVGKMAFGESLPPAVPRGRLLAAKQAAERARRPAAVVDLRGFWEDYVLGRDGKWGFEILAATRAYRSLMSEQMERLQIVAGDRVADLGSGAGEFAAMVAERSLECRITAVDFVQDALRKGRTRSSRATEPVVADLSDGVVPLASGAFDAVLASLLISYVTRPERLLSEVRRLLKIGGRAVISCPRRDADLSRIYVDGVRELDPAAVRRLFGSEAEAAFGRLQRDLLHQGARLLSLEDEGWFHFWDEEELVQMMERAGFTQVGSTSSFGDPPQVSLAWGTRAQ